MLQIEYFSPTYRLVDVITASSKLKCSCFLNRQKLSQMGYEIVCNESGVDVVKVIEDDRYWYSDDAADDSNDCISTLHLNVDVEETRD